jgi:hypothetical protein
MPFIGVEDDKQLDEGAARLYACRHGVGFVQGICNKYYSTNFKDNRN